MKRRNKVKAMDAVLCVLGALVIGFTAVMIWVYWQTGGVPDSLVYSVFGVATGECGFMSWIKRGKDKNAAGGTQPPESEEENHESDA